ncbi:hypothetical protein BFP97_08900 [Roseivirga sp. 4D4]|nr:hypothetical protein [Roseivirga sp. 4D4]OEK01624.1 hypothetical protein BFP97_08900 [Roseivirga sp. 4D4]
MDRFLKNFILFLGFTGIGYCLILCVWSYLIPFDALKKNMNYRVGSYGHMHTRMKEVRQVKEIDVLILGSSHAYRGFDPRIFRESGIEIFNMGSSNQTPKQALSLLKTYIDRLNPQLVIYEVYPGIFQHDGVESSLDIIANEPLNWRTIDMALTVNHLKTYNTLIFDVFVESLGLYDSYQEPLTRGDDLYVSGGYVEKSDNYTRQQTRREKSSWKLRQDQLNLLSDISDFVEMKNIDFLMIQSPVDSINFRSIRNQEEIDKVFESEGDYINLNNLMNLSYPEDLYDLHHLRQSGVDKFNRLLISVLEERGFLK